LSFVSQIEANNAREVKGISLETLFKISSVLEIPVSKLFDSD
jgi:transcriptional regulator with XRE-family HTH domain